MAVSVIIPTYKSPEALDLCLRSAIEGQMNANQIIVVVDGHYDINKEVLDKHKDSIQLLIMEENVGLCRGTNLGVYNAKHEQVLIVNDDNVFPSNWDFILEDEWEEGTVLTPNQIEPFPSMFKQFIINDLGRNPKTFDLSEFWFQEDHTSGDKVEESGSTLPIFMSKLDYLRVGGWDENYELGMVADCDFFLKCRLADLKMMRNWNLHFYHFVSLETKKSPESTLKRQQCEQRGHEYFKYKWGGYMKRDINNNILKSGIHKR